MTSMRLLVNPAAGGGRAAGVARRALDRLRARGVAADLQTPTTPDDLVSRVHAAATAGLLVVACGGDGTLSLVAGALAESDATMGIVPAGRGNDFARALGIPRHPGAAADLLLDGRSKAVDLGRVGDRWFCTVAMTGFDAEVAAVTAARAGPGGLGRLEYFAAGLRMLPSYQPAHLKLTGDFGEVEDEMLLAAAANNSSYGGGMRIAPPARPDDGVLHLCLVRAAPWYRFLPLLPQVYAGRHTRSSLVRIVRTREVLIESERPLAVMSDGEPAGTTPVRIRVVREALRVIRP